MNRKLPTDTAPASHVARLAVAQFMLFDAALESLSTLGENLARRRARPAGREDGEAGEEFSASELTEPFRVRYEYFRRMP